jgi:hypothetical protein
MRKRNSRRSDSTNVESMAVIDACKDLIRRTRYLWRRLQAMAGSVDNDRQLDMVDGSNGSGTRTREVDERLVCRVRVWHMEASLHSCSGASNYIERGEGIGVRG